MVIERLINESGTFPVLLVTPEYEEGTLRYTGYRYSNYEGNVKEVHYKWRYIYDGFEFIGGDFGMTEVSTCFAAVWDSEIEGKITAEKVIARFKEKIAEKGAPLSIILRDLRLKNFDLETWLTNLLIS